MFGFPAGQGRYRVEDHREDRTQRLVGRERRPRWEASSSPHFEPVRFNLPGATSSSPNPVALDLVDSFIVATHPFVSRKTLSTRRVNLGYRFLDASPTPPHLYTGSALGPRRELKSSSPPLLSPGTPTIATNFTFSFRQCAASKPCLRLPVGAGNLIPRSRNHPGFWRNHDKTTVASLTQICAIASLRSVMSRFGIRFPVIRPDSSKKEHAAVASDDAGVSDGSLTVLSAEAFPSIAPLLSLWHDPRGASTATCVCHTWLGRERYDIILKLRCRIPSPSVTRIIVSQQPITQLSDVQFLLGNSM
ncbi:hypothetical protein DTO217A2_4470 [Paecilomyces variotii]|nr:hypothetical protein DTO217A2_4470 [Paecilomyces variotii]